MSHSIEMTKQPQKIHPQKFALWIAMASIVMMFAGLTSAYVVKQSQGNWRSFQLPFEFWISTGVILLSSVTFYLGIKAFKEKALSKFRVLITITLLLGILFGVMQYLGFYQLYHQSQTVVYDGAVQYVHENGVKKENVYPVRVDGNPSESFLFVIAGLHLLHILGGIVALAIVYYRAIRKNIPSGSTTGMEMAATYWHFVDILWIYLFIFFLVNH
jgi:cytochrome c oxidase subunit 3